MRRERDLAGSGDAPLSSCWKMLNQPPPCLNANSSGSLTPNSGAAQDGDQRQRILRIGERAQQHRQGLDLGRLAKGACAAHLDRDVQRLEGTGIGREAVALLPGENQEVAELPSSGIDFRSDVGRDLSGVLLLELVDDRSDASA